MPSMRDEAPPRPIGWQAVVTAAVAASAIYALAALPFASDSDTPAAILFAIALGLALSSNRTRQLTALMVSAAAILRVLAAAWS